VETFSTALNAAQKHLGLRHAGQMCRINTYRRHKCCFCMSQAQSMGRSRGKCGPEQGLGESIVGGTVTPDVYTVRKADCSVLSRRISEKTRMTVPVPGGTREVFVPRFLQSRSALDDAQIRAIARLALDLESTMGWAVDVECALHGEAWFLLQCRPITTLRERGHAPAQPYSESNLP
jgi:hypothetical protein